MSELALYRKYRSKNLDEVVGQPHVVTTLASAVRQGRISHAYLFTGPRGVGKTSVARILARMVNCEGQTKPCGKCPQCLAETHLDIIEIDAASNRSIDEIRELRSKIHSAPSFGKFKIYIIDEVHMLTKEAFNALLKTLEEPPAHAIFVLATTEAQKLPATVISRTQRFNFRPLSINDSAAQLKKVAAAEKLKIDDEAIQLLARYGEGSLRDSLSLLDQATSSGEAVDAAAVRSLLGFSDTATIDQLLLAIGQGEIGEALKLLDRLSGGGSSPGQIAAQLSQRLRELLLVGAGVNLNDEAGTKIMSQLSVAQVAHLQTGLITTSKSPQPALALEAWVAGSAATNQTSAPKAIPQIVQPVQGAPKPEPATITAKPQPKIEPTEPGHVEPIPEQAYDLLKAANHSLYALVRTCDLTLSGNQALISCRFNFHYERLKEDKNRRIIEQALTEAVGQDVVVIIEHNPTAGPSVEKSTELVSSALEILGGEVIGE